MRDSASARPSPAAPAGAFRSALSPPSPAPPLRVSRHQLIFSFSFARSRESASRRPASDSEPRAASSAAGQPRTREGLHAPASQPTPGILQPGEATGAHPAAGTDSQLLSPPLASARDPGTSRFSGTGAEGSGVRELENSSTSPDPQTETLISGAWRTEGSDGGYGKQGQKRQSAGRDAIPRVTESGGMWQRQPGGPSPPGRRSLFQPGPLPLHCHQLPPPCGVRKTGELRPLLPLTFLPAWGLATSPRRLGWRPGSSAPHDPRVPLCERPRQVAGGRLRAVVRGAWPRAGGIRMGRGSQDRAGGNLLQPRPVSALTRGRRSASARGQGLSPKPAGSRAVPGLRRQPPHSEI